jgi:hypothetical protein
MSLVEKGGVDIRPLNRKSCWRPLRLGLLQEESTDDVAGMRGAADTSKMFRATRPARASASEWKVEYCMITDQP